MNLRQLDLNLLVALDALLTERNITEAGRRLSVTQSAMSGSLARLREYFGDEILVQIGRRMVLTPLAESLAEPIRDILIKVKAAVTQRPGFDPARSTRRFSLMMSDYASTVLMNDVLRRAAQIAPGVEFEILANDVPAPLEVLERADVDLLLMPRDFLSSEHPQEVLFTDSYACILWKDNTQVGNALSREEYLRLGHVSVQFNRGRSPVIDEWFLSRLGVSRRLEVLTMNFNSIPQLLVGTDRIATVHRRLAEFYCRYLPLRVVDCPYELPAITEAVQWHKYFTDDPGLAWLRALLQEVAHATSAAAPAR